MMNKCCLTFDENDCCIKCGKPLEMPDLGDIVGICKLSDVTAAECSKIKPSSHMHRTRKLLQSYKKAKALGYRGDLLRWIEFVQERMLDKQGMIDA